MSDHNRFLLYTRNGNDWTHRFPAVHAAELDAAELVHYASVGRLCAIGGGIKIRRSKRDEIGFLAAMKGQGGDIAEIARDRSRKLKLRGLMEYGVLGSEYTQAFHQRWIWRKNPDGEPLCTVPATSNRWPISATASRSSAKMNVLPIAVSDFIATVLPGLLRALLLATTVMPLGVILKSLLKLEVNIQAPSEIAKRMARRCDTLADSVHGDKTGRLVDCTI